MGSVSAGVVDVLGDRNGIGEDVAFGRSLEEAVPPGDDLPKVLRHPERERVVRGPRAFLAEQVEAGDGPCLVAARTGQLVEPSDEHLGRTHDCRCFEWGVREGVALVGVERLVRTVAAAAQAARRE